MPMKGWLAPQIMFCSAIAKLNAEAEMLRSTVTGSRKMPRLWRSPMQSERMSALTASSMTRLGRAAPGAVDERGAVDEEEVASRGVGATESVIGHLASGTCARGRP